MRTQLLIAAAMLLAGAIVVRAADRKFPYEAIVNVEDGEYVRSGPGPKYYPTDRLRKGDRVMVHRHDPGGWCMIAPPAGSFSWVRAEHIHKNPNGTGTLKTSGVVVHIGSTINPDDFNTVQANLSQGDAVEILGEKTFTFEDGSRLMYKISPVKREWRWIARKSIDATDSINSEPFPPEQNRKKKNGPVASLDDDSVTKPISARPPQTSDEATSSSRDQSGASEEMSIRKTGPGAELSAASRKQLEDIDQQFREMIRLDPSVWNLDSLDDQYAQLDEDVGLPAMSEMISLRQDAVKRYRKIHQDYMEFFKQTSDTRQRDAELKALQGQPQGTAPAIALNSPAGNPTAQSTPVRTPSPPITVPRPGQPQPAPAFDGAGIVQKMAQTFAGGPQFVLISPDGRMLSFLQAAPGVDLNRYVGKSMGVTGQRVHRDDWNADVITVRGLQPVQLRGSR